MYQEFHTGVNSAFVQSHPGGSCSAGEERNKQIVEGNGKGRTILETEIRILFRTGMCYSGFLFMTKQKDEK